jgi:hypothetical protein
MGFAVSQHRREAVGRFLVVFKLDAHCSPSLASHEPCDPWLWSPVLEAIGITDGWWKLSSGHRRSAGEGGIGDWRGVIGAFDGATYPDPAGHCIRLQQLSFCSIRRKGSSCRAGSTAARSRLRSAVARIKQMKSVATRPVVILLYVHAGCLRCRGPSDSTSHHPSLRGSGILPTSARSAVGRHQQVAVHPACEH